MRGIEAGGDLHVVSQANNNLGGVRLGGIPVERAGAVVLENAGAAQLKVYGLRVSEGADQFAVAGLPAGTSLTNPFMLEPGATLSISVAFLAGAIGLQRGTIQILTNDADSPVTNLTVVGTGLAATGGGPQRGDDFIALQTTIDGQTSVQRLRSDGLGVWTARPRPAVRSTSPSSTRRAALSRTTSTWPIRTHSVQPDRRPVPG